MKKRKESPSDLERRDGGWNGRFRSWWTRRRCNRPTKPMSAEQRQSLLQRMRAPFDPPPAPPSLGQIFVLVGRYLRQALADTLAVGALVSSLAEATNLLRLLGSLIMLIPYGLFALLGAVGVRWFVLRASVAGDAVRRHVADLTTVLPFLGLGWYAACGSWCAAVSQHDVLVFAGILTGGALASLCTAVQLEEISSREEPTDSWTHTLRRGWVLVAILVGLFSPVIAPNPSEAVQTFRILVVGAAIVANIWNELASREQFLSALTCVRAFLLVA